MNITREKIGDLELSIKIDVAENDYAERVAKQLKTYKQKVTVPGFRKGMAPMGLIERMYKPSIVAEEVQNLLSESLYKYLEDEKLDIIGSPLSNEEKTGDVDFAKSKDYTFYFDAALVPEFNIQWDKVSTTLNQIKITPKEAEKQVEDITKRFGDFQTPEEVGEKDFVYGKAVELDKNGAVKEGGLSTFTSFDISTIKDDENRALFLGKKTEEKVVFNAAKAFTAADIEKNFHLEAAAAKKFKADVEFTISGCSRVVPHEVNEELFAKVFPGQAIKDAAAFKKAVTKEMEKSYNEQCQILFVNEVRKALIDQFDAKLPEKFLKRWILSRSNEKDLTAEKLDAEWEEKYIPSLKWEFVDGALNKISPIEPTQNEIVDHIKGIIRENDKPVEGEDEKAKEDRLERAARSIASDRRNIQQVIDRLSGDKTFALFKEKLNPEVEKISIKEFGEKVK